MKKTLISTLFSILILSLFFSGCKKKNVDGDIVVPEETKPYSFIKINGDEYVFENYLCMNSSLAGKYRVTRELSNDNVLFKLVAKNQDGSNITGATLVTDSENITMTINFLDVNYNVQPQTELKVYQDSPGVFYATSSGIAVSEDASMTINYELGYVN
mgnify:FL=1